MVMSKKEYERMEFYRDNATKYAQNLDKKERQINDFKAYLSVRSKMLGQKTTEKKIIDEILQYVTTSL